MEGRCRRNNVRECALHCLRPQANVNEAPMLLILSLPMKDLNDDPTQAKER
jgi:hypothetical protein